MFSSSTASEPSPTFGNSIIVIPIEWPVTWPRWYPRSLNPFETATWTSWQVGAGAHRDLRRFVVLGVGLHHPLRVVGGLGVGGPDRAGDLDPVHAGAGDLE